MAITRNAVQVTWSSNPYSDLTTASNDTSDVVTFDATGVDAMIQLKADNQAGSPASDATVDFYVLYSSGDPDADPDSSDEYDTTGPAMHLAKLDVSSGGADPQIAHVGIPVAAKAYKVYAVNNGVTDTIRVSAQMTEVRSS